MAYLAAQDGKRYELHAKRMTIGRHPDCEIALVKAGRVSRKHAEIVCNGENYTITDLESRNHTFVNEVELKAGYPHTLTEGDRIRVCDVTLGFYLKEPAGSKRPTASTQDLDALLHDGSSGSDMEAILIEDEDSDDDSSSTIMSKLEVSSESGGGVLVTASLQARLTALIEITRNLGKALALDEVLPQVLNSLFKIFLQADRGFIVLRAEDGTLVPRWTRARRSIGEDTIRISKTIVQHVMDTREAILSADATRDERLDMSQSIADLKIRSMMCAPLLDSEGKASGIIQIDTLDQRKRFNQEDLEVLGSVGVQAGVAIHNAQLHERALRQKEIQQDLELAREVQKAFLPQAQPALSDYEFYDYYRAANHVGGDYYDYISLPDGRTAVIVADVVGHGIAAAMIMAKIAAEAKFCMASEADPATALTRLNNTISDMEIERFVTLVMIVLDPKTHEVTIVNAGHMAPIWRRANATIEEPGANSSGLPVGIMGGMEYRRTTITLERGDMLAMYTDGINEAMAPTGEQYTIDRLRAHLVKADQDTKPLGKTIIDDVLGHIGNGPQADDMCLVLLRRL